jgi:hypothetical protein
MLKLSGETLKEVIPTSITENIKGPKIVRGTSTL